MMARLTVDPVAAAGIKAKVLTYLQQIGLPETEPFVVVGTSGLFLQGLLETFHDIDLLIPSLPKFRKATVDDVEVQGFPNGEYIAQGFTQLEIQQAQTLFEMQVQSGENGLIALTRLNRPKDRPLAALVEQRLQEP
jgi:hypothetical protein